MPHDLVVAQGHDRIVIVPRDPETAFVYWEITANGVARSGVRTLDPQFELRIRVRDDEGEPHVVFQASVSRWLDGTFVPFGELGAVHDAVVGVVNGREFVPLATSQIVRAPRSRAGQEDAEFVSIELDGRGIELTPVTHAVADVGQFHPYLPNDELDDRETQEIKPLKKSPDT